MNITQVIHDMPLKEMDGSLLTLNILNGVGAEDVAEIRHAIELAAYLHRKKTRNERGVMPKDHYIAHPLRNAVRLMRWGCLDKDLLIATILHDTIEDHYDEILELSSISVSAEMTKEEQMKAALGVMTEIFGARVGRALQGVTNPVFAEELTKLEKQQEYRVHVIDAIADQDVLLVKLVDLLDNAGSLHHHQHSNPGMVKSMTGKYFPLVGVFIDEVKKTTLLSTSSIRLAVEQLEKLSDRLSTLKLMA